MHFPASVIAVPALLAIVTANPTVYTYNCSKSCHCDATDSAEFSSGTNGECINVDVGLPISVGLSGGSSFWCQAYNQVNCQGSEQNVGINNGQTWGCTAAQHGQILSLRCYNA